MIEIRVLRMISGPERERKQRNEEDYIMRRIIIIIIIIIIISTLHKILFGKSNDEI